MVRRTYEVPRLTRVVKSNLPDIWTFHTPSWSDLHSKVSELNTTAGNETSYKVLILGRHGQGYHNVGEAKHGNTYRHWALLNGDDQITWGPDPILTPLGEEQARTAHAAWKTELANGLTLPQKFYCSPMARALRTHTITFDGILPASDRKTIILEDAREEYGEHTCDKRRSRAAIAADFPDFVFENGFADEDVLWTKERETKESAERRARNVLDRIFDADTDATYVSITAHGGIINAILRVVGRGNFGMTTGGKHPPLRIWGVN
ncbi:phosphoglycerate mutase-like protein [Stereum hirsutum FP-91666 SS1]|uniref:phosphoglycerate mutase-like protein n=1 Tax=Stereum hirsutum (strain FP-91666) TaxID=721885 RepID=UPI000440B28F|nr:phosphoglycerate mutase-like protein [Stereum hirsutum FP-91666 SS1]EIM92820.1 phosphoglycerate mutase-like protein [Stereum hirsutum FP-91666 SS1]